MTEHPKDEFTREERAFRAAFDEVDAFAPLDPEQFTRPARRRMAWPQVLSAAAAVVVFAGVGIGFAQFAGRGMPSTAAGSAATGLATADSDYRGESVGGGVGEPAPQAPASTGLDAGSMTWRATSQAPLTRVSPATGWLDGRFYLIGGAAACGPSADCKAHRDGAAYDPSTDSWTPVAAAPVWLNDTVGVAFAGKLYFLAGESGTSSRLLGYDPANDSWTTTSTPARLGGLVVAGDQLIGVGLGTRLGGDATDRIYDPATSKWTDLPPDPSFPGNSRDLVVVDDRLFLSTYSIITGKTTYATFNLATRSWTVLHDLTAAGRMVAVAGSVVFLQEDAAVLESFRVADGASSGIAMDFGREAIDKLKATGMLDLNGTVVGMRVVHYGELFDPGSNALTLLPELPTAKLTGQVAIGSPDALLVYRVTGTGDEAKATAHYLPVTP